MIILYRRLLYINVKQLNVLIVLILLTYNLFGFSHKTWQNLYRHAVPILAIVKLKCGYFKHSYWTYRPNFHPKLLLVKTPSSQQNRGYVMLAARIVKGVLKVRYLILGGALGGGYTLQKVCKQCTIHRQ